MVLLQLFFCSPKINCNLPIVEIPAGEHQYLLDGDYVEYVDASGQWEVTALLCYEEYGVVQELTGTVGLTLAPTNCSGSGTPVPDDCNEIKLCVRNANLDLAHGPVEILVDGSGPADLANVDGFQKVLIYLNGDMIEDESGNEVLDISSATLTELTLQEDAGKVFFEPEIAGLYTVVIKRGKTFKPCQASIIVYNTESTSLQFRLKFEGIAKPLPDTTSYEDDCEAECMTDYYCITDSELKALCEDLSSTNVTFVKDCSNNNEVLDFADPSGQFYRAGWILSKQENGEWVDINNGVFKADDGEYNGDGLNFASAFKVANCNDSDSLERLRGIYRITLFDSEAGLICGEKRFHIVPKPLESVTLSIADGKSNLLKCGQNITLESLANGGNSAGVKTYQWYANGKLLEGKTSSTLEVSYDMEAGVYQVVVSDSGFEFTEDDGVTKVSGVCKSEKVSNSVVLCKRFAVRISNKNAENESEKVSVNVSKDMHLEALVEGVDEDECAISYQWFLKDCNGNYKLTDGARCLIGNKKELIIAYDSENKINYINSCIEVIASYQRVSDMTGSGELANCFKSTKIISASDSIKTRQKIDVSINKISQSTNLLYAADGISLRVVINEPISSEPDISWCYDANADGEFSEILVKDTHYTEDPLDKTLVTFLRVPENKAGFYRAKVTYDINGCKATGHAEQELTMELTNFNLIVVQSEEDRTEVINPDLIYVNGSDCPDHTNDMVFYVPVEADNLPAGFKAVAVWSLCDDKYPGTETDPAFVLDTNVADPSICYDFASGNLLNFNKKFEELGRCIFWNCNNKATLKLKYNIVRKEDDVTLVTFEKQVELTQQIGVLFGAKDESGNDVAPESDSTYNLSGGKLTLIANPCGLCTVETDASANVDDPVASETPTTYQWFKGTTPLTLATAFNMLSVSAKGEYRVVVKRLMRFLKDASGNYATFVFKAEGTVIVADPTLPMTHVSVRTTQKNNIVSFNASSVVVSAGSSIGKLKAYVTPEQSNLSFQWYKNDKPIDGANSSIYNPGSGKESAGAYSVKVTNAKGSLASNPYAIVFRK